jgi:hypothetical protein
MIDFSNSRVETGSLFSGKVNGYKILFFRLSMGAIGVIICNYGCAIVSIEVADRTGTKKNVAGLASLQAIVSLLRLPVRQYPLANYEA